MARYCDVTFVSLDLPPIFKWTLIDHAHTDLPVSHVRRTERFITLFYLNKVVMPQTTRTASLFRRQDYGIIFN